MRSTGSYIIYSRGDGGGGREFIFFCQRIDVLLNQFVKKIYTPKNPFVENLVTLTNITIFIGPSNNPKQCLNIILIILEN